jgi:hypothetical protein
MFRKNKKIIHDNNSIQFNTINFIYLRADLAAQRPITKPARVEKKKQKRENTKKDTNKKC